MDALSLDLLPAVLQSIADGVIVWDAEGRMLFANDHAARMTGFSSADELMRAPRDQVLSRFELLDPNGNPLPVPALPGRQALAGGGPTETVIRYRVKDTAVERWSLVAAVPITNDDGSIRAVVSSFRDITNEISARKAAEESGLRQSFLAEVSHQLASSLDYEATLAAIARLAVPRVADWCTVDLVDEGGIARRLATAHSDPAKVELAEELRRRFPIDASPPRALRTGEPELYPDITEAMIDQMAPGEELRDVLRALGLKSAMVLPLTARGRTLGALTFVSAESGRRYTEDDLELAGELAHRAALSVDNARLYRELDQRVLQRTEELEEQLRVTREQARLLELAPDAIMVRAFAARELTYWSHGAEQLYGWTRAEALGQDVHELLKTRFPKPLDDVLVDLVRVGHWEGELVHTRKDGSEVVVSSHWVLQRDEAGTPVSFLEINTDIAAQKQAEQERAARVAAESVAARTALLAESSRVFAGAGLNEQQTLDTIAQWLAEAIGDSCIIRVLSEDGGTLRPAAVGHPDPEGRRVLAEMVAAFVHRADQEPAAGVIASGRSLRIPINDRGRLRSQLTPEQWPYIERLGPSSLLYTPITVHGSVIGVTIMARNAPGEPYTEEDQALLQSVADRAALAIENARLYQEALTALHVRDEFLAVAAHELKTPITGLRLAADLFLRSAERQGATGAVMPERAARSVRDQAVKLTHLVEQLLDVSRLEGGRLALDRTDVDLASLVKVVASAFRDRSDAPVLVVAPTAVPVRADALRVEQVLVNLLENARKFGPPTSAIVLEAWSSNGVAHVAVTDRGPGVPEEHRERIFDRFYQVQPLIHAPGMGLGLYISRQIAQLHGGDLTAEFPPGGGSRFLLTLPR